MKKQRLLIDLQRKSNLSFIMKNTNYQVYFLTEISDTKEDSD